MKLNWLASVLAGILLIVGFLYAIPKSDFVQPGRWVHMVNRVSLDMYETHLMPGQRVTLEQSHLVFNNKGETTTCMLFEATNGLQTIDVTTWAMDVYDSVNSGSFKLRDPVLSNAPRSRCLQQQAPKISISSATRQVVRVLFFYPAKGHPQPITTGYQTGLCDTFAYDNCNRKPLTPVQEYFSPAEARAYNRDKLQTGLLIMGSGLGVLALGHPSFLAYALFSMLNTLLPSTRTRRVKEEIKRAANEETTFDAKTTESYRQQETSSFRKKQDIQDLEGLIEQTRRENQKLREKERKLAEDEAAEQQLVEEINASVKRIKELQVKLKNMKQK